MGRTTEQDRVRSAKRARLAWGLAALSLAACTWAACSGDDDDASTPASGCVTGQAVLCSCENGTNGVQLCGRDGVFGGCFCTGQPSGGGGTSSGSTGDAGSSKPDGGTSGAGAAGSAAGASGGGGRAGGTAGASGSGTAGAAGSAGKGGNAGSAGSSGSGNAGSSGSSGSGGSGGFGGGFGGFGGFGGSGGTSGAYVRCNTSGLCREGLLCVDTMQGGGNIGYCAPECMPHDDGTVTDCPQPATGDVEAFCVPVANLCVLGPCSEGVSCPRGMTCTSSGSSGQPSCHYTMR